MIAKCFRGRLCCHEVNVIVIKILDNGDQTAEIRMTTRCSSITRALWQFSLTFRVRGHGDFTDKMSK